MHRAVMTWLFRTCRRRDSDSEWDDAETSARKTSPVDELDEDQEDSSNRRELMDVE